MHLAVSLIKHNDAHGCETHKEIHRNSESLQSIHAPHPIQFSAPDARITDTLPADLVGMFVNENQNPWQLLIDLQRMFEGDTALASVCMRALRRCGAATRDVTAAVKRAMRYGDVAVKWAGAATDGHAQPQDGEAEVSALHREHEHRGV